MIQTMMRIIAALLLALMSCQTAAEAQIMSVVTPHIESAKRNVRFRHLTKEDGLPSNNVSAILQDQHGFIWIGTEEGFCRFDGYRLITYKHDPDQENSLSANNVTAMFEDRGGMLWIGTDGGGVNRFDPTTETFTHYHNDPADPNSLSGNIIFAIMQDRAGNFWFGGPPHVGLNKFNPATNTFTRYHSNQEARPASEWGAVNDMREDQAGNLWLAAESALVKFYPDTGQFTPYSLTSPTQAFSVMNIESDANGHLWLSGNQGLYEFNPDSAQFIHHQLGDHAILTLRVDATGNLWLGTTKGLKRFDPRTKQVIASYQHDPTNRQSVNEDFIGTLYEDQSGILWCGTKHGGLNMLDTQQPEFVSYREEEIFAMSGGREGRIWFGTRRQLNEFDPTSGQIVRYDLPEENLPEFARITSIYRDRNGAIWFGLLDRVYRFDEQMQTVKMYRPAGEELRAGFPPEVASFAEDKNGDLWVALERGGLYRFQPETETFHAYLPERPSSASSVRSDTIYSGGLSVISADRAGNLWIGYEEGVLSRYDPDTKTFAHSGESPDALPRLPPGDMDAIYEDRANLLWIASQSGLIRVDRQRAVVTRYTEKHGLPSTMILGILEDQAGFLWLSTQGGLAKFDPRTETCRNYDMFDGVQGNEFNRAFWQNPDGQMFFGGENGLTAFYPDRITDIPDQAPVLLTEMRLFNQSVPVGENSILKQPIWDTDYLTLAHNQNIIAFEFATLSYAAPQKNRYRYKLDGLETQWNDVDSQRRFAAYTDLESGTYLLRVQGSNARGVWSTQEATLRITVLPPWWETWWWRGIMVIALLSLILGAHRWRVQVIKAHNRELERLVAERTQALQRSNIELNQEVLERKQAQAELLATHTELKGTLTHLQRTQSELIQAEKMAALGKLIANIAHEINTPIGAIRASAGNIGTTLDLSLQTLPAAFRALPDERLPDLIAFIRRACQPKTALTSREERQRKRALIQQLEERDLSEADMLADTLIDMGIYDDVDDVCALLRDQHADALLQATSHLASQRHNSDNIINAVERVSKIVFALKSYAHTDASGEVTSARVTDGLDIVLTLYYNQLKHGIEVVKHYADTPPIRCYPDELNQVWTNLIHNAIQAMQGKGRLEICVSRQQPTPCPSQVGSSGMFSSLEGNSGIESFQEENVASETPLLGGAGGGSGVVIEITDSGCGIPDVIKDRIFEPFFTTKPAGEGSGLGLDICKKIIDKHQGKIEFESQPGRTTFRVFLPILQR